jgi:hypothetical protein
MSCIDGIAKAIDSTCATQGVGGVEQKGWLMNREDIDSITQVDNVVSALTMKSTKQAFTATIVAKSMNAGHDIKIEEGYADRYTHYASIKIFENDSAAQLNADNLKDLVVIVERKQKSTTGDGVFLMYGLEAGLYKTADSARLIENNGARLIEMATDGATGEKYSSVSFFDTDYTTTKAAIVALETPAV